MIVFAIKLVVKGRPTMVLFEETPRTIAVSLGNCARNMVQDQGPRIQATIQNCKQLYRWGMQELVVD